MIFVVFLRLVWKHSSPTYSPFLPEDRLHQDPSPISLQLKEQGVGVFNQVIRSCFDEKPISDPRLEDYSVQEYVLSLLAETEKGGILISI